MNDTLITIHTDHGPVALPSGSTVQHLIDHLVVHVPAALPSAAFATAVNGDFVARGARSGHPLRDGDTVLCFTAITGG